MKLCLLVQGSPPCLQTENTHLKLFPAKFMAGRFMRLCETDMDVELIANAVDHKGRHDPACDPPVNPSDLRLSEAVDRPFFFWM